MKQVKKTRRNLQRYDVFIPRIPSTNLFLMRFVKEIILAFFKKDFAAGRQWEMHDPEVTEIGHDVYKVKMSATYTSKNKHKVASAQGVVRCLPEKREVRVENYIYDMSGGS
mmetsp:Transcript_685/g.1229  ORF Transcript_685/g.1229 Transcript_685/m.1229 type:complete len:111 (-) Transcript_685:299-631(-)